MGDLSAVQRGDVIECHFTPPATTTDDLDIERFRIVDLRVGEDNANFDLGTWASTAVAVPIDLTQARSGQSLTARISVVAWQGKNVVIGARTAEKTKHPSAWSNLIHLRVVEAPSVPVLHLESVPEGVRVRVDTLEADAKLHILRQGPGEAALSEAGVMDSKEWIDPSAQFGVKYLYAAYAAIDTDHANARSQTSEAQPFTAIDKFSPSVPADLAALTGPASIELSWTRGMDNDLRGYLVFRSIDGGPFERIGSLTAVPAFSDRAVEHGKTYRYQISAVDIRDNESARSGPVEVTFN